MFMAATPVRWVWVANTPAGPVAIRQAKASIRRGAGKSIEEALSIEIDAYKACLYTKDRLEGLKAFAEKRKPVFKGE